MSVPPGLEEVLKDFTVQAIQEQPENLSEFGVKFFSNRQEADGAGATDTMMDTSCDGDNAGGGVDDLLTEPEGFFPRFNRGKRKSVFVEALDLNAIRSHEPTQHEKSLAQQTKLRAAIGNIFLFQHLGDEEVEMLVSAMQERETYAGEHIIEQGHDGDNFYVVDKGLFDVYVQGVHVGEYVNQGHFGELALLHNCPRAASVMSVGGGCIWSLDQLTFRQIILKNALSLTDMYEEQLKQSKLLQDLSNEERGRLADSLERVKFLSGQRIITQGNEADAMYIILQGSARVTRHLESSQQEVTLCSLKEGDYFGELALLHNMKRAASVWAETDVICARVTRETFERVLGPCRDILERRAGGYEDRLSELFGPSKNGTYLGLELTNL